MTGPQPALPAPRRFVEFEVAAVVPPQAVWQAVARAPQPYVLVGDGDHRSFDIRQQVYEGARILLEQGAVRHIGLEIDHAACQPVFDRLAGRKPGQVTPDLLRFAALPLTSHLGLKHRLANRTLMLGLLGQAGRQGAKVHCLNVLSQEVRVNQRQVRHRFRQRLAGDLVVAGLPGWLARLVTACPWLMEPGVSSTFEAIMSSQMRHARHVRNRALDPDRAHMFRVAAGDDRAMLVYGLGHFRGPGQQGIDDWLPRDRQVLVALMSPVTHQLQSGSLYPGHTGVVRPDFVIDAWSGTGQVTRQAVSRGLWPAAAVRPAA